MQNRLRELRERKGISLDELSSNIGMPKTSLSNYERGNREPKREIWKKLAEYYNVSISYIMGLEDSNSVSWEEYDDQLKKKYGENFLKRLNNEISLYEEGFALDDLVENDISLSIDNVPLSAQERKALSFFLDGLRELRK